jgi:hypothetical protein
VSRHISRADLANMSSSEISEAVTGGHLKHLLDPPSVTLADLETWDGDDIVAARTEGRLRHLGVDPEPRAETLVGADLGARGKRYGSMRERLRDMSVEEIVAAHRRGDLDGLLRGEVK